MNIIVAPSSLEPSQILNSKGGQRASCRLYLPPHCSAIFAELATCDIAKILLSTIKSLFLVGSMKENITLHLIM